MRRLIGITILAVSTIAGLALLLTGNFGSSRIAHQASGGTLAGGWEVTVVEFMPNWLLVGPLAIGIVVGLLAALLPSRR